MNMYWVVGDKILKEKHKQTHQPPTSPFAILMTDEDVGKQKEAATLPKERNKILI